MSFQPSHYQQAVFDHVADVKAGNAIVEAVAGSGKSKTIEEAYKLVHGQAIFLAFNKAIADELKGRGLNARTFHSLTFSPVMQFKRQRQPQMDKLRKLCRENMTEQEFKLYASFAQKMVGLARGEGIGCLTEDTLRAWTDIADHHDIEPESENADFNEGVLLARQLLDWSNASVMVDFDDMLYLAIKENIALPKFDFVFVDEAQDTNAIQRAIIKKIMRPGARLVAVGDPAQAIYGFRGADSNSLRLIAEEFECKTLPLSITYRCPTSVVSYAQQWVSHIEARDNAPEGTVEHFGTDWDISTLKPQDLVVCRKTAPLVTLALKMIRGKRQVQILGNELGQGLKALIKKMNANGIDMLEKKLEAYQEREVKKARDKDDDQYAEMIMDKVGSILFLITCLQETKRTIAELEIGIDYLFKDKTNAVTLCTIHKSKGLEAERVFWLNRSECPSKWARQDWQKEQEDNLCYVAATRAKSYLATIELKEEDQ